MDSMRLKTIVVELTHHFPFSLFSASLGIVVIGLVTIIVGGYSGVHPPAETEDETRVEAVTDSAGTKSADTMSVGAGSAAGHGREQEHAEHAGAEGLPGLFTKLFHVFHPLHILFSAIATTAMFWRYDRKLIRAIVIGVVGSVGICGLSDILIPFLGGLASGKHMHLHVCLIEHPSLVIPFAILGVVVGIIAADVLVDRRSTLFSHSSHVLVSTMASLLYLVSFGFTDWMDAIFKVLAIVVIAVVLPCCTSDIVFPLLLISPEGRERAACGHVGHGTGGQAARQECGRQGQDGGQG
ncbi:MAG: hypothetical protein V2A71_07255 [Candidatus Eisenbacteria bacterium]